MKIFDFLFELKAEFYQSIIDDAKIFCDHFLLIERKEIPLNSLGQKILNDLNPFLLKKTEKSEWPGTKLLNGTAWVYEFQLNTESANILKKRAKSILDWQSPNLPEDLCFLRMDESPWLISITHEDDVYLKTTIQEIQMLSNNSRSSISVKDIS